MGKDMWLYIMASRSRRIYTGVTNDLKRRVYEHKHKLVPGFTSMYNMSRLVYYETFPDPRTAIAREKQVKGWVRAKKVTLIEGLNPGWDDLSEGWYEDEGVPSPDRDASTGSA